MLKFKEEQTSIDQFPETKERLRDFVENIQDELTDPFFHFDISEIDHQPRDGFIPYEHNCGGFDLIAFADIPNVADYQYGASQRCAELYEEDVKDLKKENPKMTDDEIFDCIRDCEQNTIAYRVRVMFNGHSLDVFAGWDFDTPYFRWKNEETFKKLGVPLEFDADALWSEIQKNM